MSFTTVDIRGSNHPRLRLQNCGVVLRTFAAYGPMSRRDVALRTQLTGATITNVTAELIQDGLLVALGHGEEDRPQGGRKTVLLDLNPAGPCVVAVQLGITRAQVGLCDLRGRSFGSRRWLDVDADPNTTIRKINRTIQEVMAGEKTRPIQSVGIGVAGLVDPVLGVIRNREGWEDIRLGDALSAVGVPVYVDSIVAGLTRAESWFGRGANAQNFLCLYVSSTLSLGIVTGHQPYRGSTFSSGQVEHLIVNPSGNPCTCGQRGCLQTAATHHALTQRAREIATTGSPLSVLLTRERDPSRLANSALRLAAAGDREALSLFEDLAKNLGIAIRQVAGLFDPELVVLAGPNIVDEVAGSWLLKRIRDAAAVSIPIVATSFTENAVLAGAAALALQRILEPDRF